MYFFIISGYFFNFYYRQAIISLTLATIIRIVVPHNRCPYCSAALNITRLTYKDCGLGLEWEFVTPRL